MTVPFFIEEPLTWKKVEVPYDIVQYCDTFTLDADREDLRYIDCVWMHMGREEWNPPVQPIFE
jgi:hypothetical protein